MQDVSLGSFHPPRWYVDAFLLGFAFIVAGTIGRLPFLIHNLLAFTNANAEAHGKDKYFVTAFVSTCTLSILTILGGVLKGMALSVPLISLVMFMMAGILGIAGIDGVAKA